MCNQNIIILFKSQKYLALSRLVEPGKNHYILIIDGGHFDYLRLNNYTKFVYPFSIDLYALGELQAKFGAIETHITEKTLLTIKNGSHFVYFVATLKYFTWPPF